METFRANSAWLRPSFLRFAAIWEPKEESGKHVPNILGIMQVVNMFALYIAQ